MKKKCKHCNISQPLDSFYKNRRMKNGYINVCKRCCISMRHSNYKESGEKIREIALEYYYKNREKKNKYQLRYYHKHKNAEGVFEERQERSRKHYKENKAKYCLKRIKRRKTEALGDITIVEINKLINDSNNICFWCDEDILKGEMHLDHVYPLSKGGGHTISNLVVSCASCNLRKRAKAPEEWLEEILEK